jgi:hypothetical protein
LPSGQTNSNTAFCVHALQEGDLCSDAVLIDSAQPLSDAKLTQVTHAAVIEWVLVTTAARMTEDTAQNHAAGSRAASVMQKLAARQAAVAAERERQQQQLETESDPRENLNTFLSGFSSSYVQLQEQCSALHEEAAAAGNDEAAKQALLQQLEELSGGITKLEQDIAGAAFFLPQYDLRSCTAQLQELRNQAAATKQQLHPKRKFAFSSKAVTRKAASQPTAAVVSPTASVQQLLQDVQLADQAAGAAASEAPSAQSAAAAAAAAAPPPSSHDLALISSGQGAMGLHGAVLVYGPGQQQQLQPGQAFVLHDLQNCTVFLVGRLSALRLQQLRRCRVYAGPVAGATFVSGVCDCTLMVASHQVGLERLQMYWQMYGLHKQDRSKFLTRRCTQQQMRG